MSIDLRFIRERVRIRLRETDARKPSFVLPEIDQAICDSYIELQAMLPPPVLTSASALTISAGASTFTLPLTVTQWTGNDGGAEYAGDVRLQLVSNGAWLRFVSNDWMDSLINNSPTIPQGVPDSFSLYERKDQQVDGRVWPAAKSAEVVNMTATMAADDLRDFIGSATDDLDDVEVQFSRTAAQALILFSAAELLERMTPDDLQARRLSGRNGEQWMQRALRLAYAEAVRRHQLEDSGVTERWVP